MIQKKILSQIEDRTFHVLQNGYYITSLFESVPMDKVKTNGFYIWKVVTCSSFGISSA